MKRLSFLVVLLLGVVFISSAQIARYSAPVFLNFTIDGEKYAIHSPTEPIVVFDIETRAQITPSGNCQVKSEFDVSDVAEILVPESGKVEIIVDRLAVWVERLPGKTDHFEVENEAKLLVGSDGMAKLVFNWEASEASAYKE